MKKSPGVWTIQNDHDLHKFSPKRVLCGILWGFLKSENSCHPNKIPTYCRWKKPVAPVEVGNVPPIIYQVLAPSQMFGIGISEPSTDPQPLQVDATGEAKSKKSPHRSYAQVDVVKMGRTQLQDAVPMPLGITLRLVSGRCKKQVVVQIDIPFPRPTGRPFGWWC